MRKNSYITVTDQFCGAGGSSEGVMQYARKSKLNSGIKVKLALNHWKLAIDTHNTNHPDTDHDCTDISACDPRRYPSTNILITSPECTNHTNSKGVKKKKHLDLFDAIDPAAERSRATMWDVCRFAEYHNYELIIVENVLEARVWIMWEAWLKAMHLLGYEHECVYLNSMHTHPTPQSRDRMYVVFWKKGNNPPDLTVRPRGYCHHCAKDTETFQWWKNTAKKFGKYKTQYLFRCPTCNNIVEPYFYSAFNCIDWARPGVKIRDRKKHGLPKLSHNTIARIKYGREKYWREPHFINVRYSSGIACRVKGVFESALSTQTGDNNIGILTPLIMNGEHEYDKVKVRDGMKAVNYTQTTRQTGAVVMPFIIKNYGGNPQRPLTGQDPLGAITGTDHHGLVTPQAWNSFMTYYYGGSNMASHTVCEPTRTFGSVDTAGLLTLGEIPKIEDCYYRMLFSKEVQKGMAFRDDYIVLGSGKDQVKQLGNAVTPPAMEWLIERGIETLL